MKSKSFGRVGLVILFFVIVILFFYFDLSRYLNFEYLKSQQARFENFQQDHRLITLTVFFVIYVLTASLSLPGATILTLAAGMMFGLGMGTLIVSFASTLGATLALLGSRYVLRDWVQAQFGERLKIVNDGIAREGNFYLFAIRLAPVFPFFLVNLLMGLTPMRAWPFAWVSQIGMLPATIVYVNAGTQLSRVTKPSDIISLKMILAFSFLGLLPIVAKKIVNKFSQKPIKT